MNKFILAIIILIAAGKAQELQQAPALGTEGSDQELQEEPSFIKVSDHCYLLHIQENRENLAVVATEQGALLFDPPPEPDLSILIESLNSLPPRPVRWMINTGQYPAQAEGVKYFSRQGAVLLTGFRREEALNPVRPPSPFSFSTPGIYLRDSSSGRLRPFSGSDYRMLTSPGLFEEESPAVTRFIFKQRMYLYPENVEIQIQELQHEARTGADIFAYVPDEKVLFVGRLFEPDYYPDIDVSAGGSALKWIDALSQVIDSVPLLVSAIPAEDDEEDSEEMTPATEGAGDVESAAIDGNDPEGTIGAEEEEEKTLEEMIAVIPARGEVSNLQMMKDMLDAAKKLRRSIERAVKSGQSCENYLDSTKVNPFLGYGNFFPFAAKLCTELSPEPEMEGLELNDPE